MTETANQLRNEPIRKVFIKYLIPSTFGLLLLSINIVIDGIFIGHGVGPNGLAAVNISIPIYAFFYGIALWIGIGGATLYSISLGKNDPQRAQIIFSKSFTIAILFSLVISVICLINMEGLAYFFGANDVIIEYVLDYMFVLLAFGVFFVLESVLSVFVRNDGNPVLAMISLIVAAVLNVFLNYIFIFMFEWGVKGAAYATILATVIAFIVMLFHFFRKSSILKFVPFRFQKNVVKQMLTIGFPSFVSEMSIAFVALSYNISFMRMIGESGVASFAIVNYLHDMVLLTFIGVGSALQPLVSFYYGAKLYEKMKESLKLAIWTSIIFGFLAVVVGFLFAEPLTVLFNVKEAHLFDMTVKGIYLFFINYVFLGYNLVYATYYQSIGQVKFSLIITIARSMLFVLVLLLILPPIIGVNGIWLAVPVAEGLTVFLILTIKKRNPKLTI